jgi:hypothetical protein
MRGFGTYLRVPQRAGSGGRDSAIANYPAADLVESLPGRNLVEVYDFYPSK